jgi:hypothetical protein
MRRQMPELDVSKLWSRGRKSDVSPNEPIPPKNEWQVFGYNIPFFGFYNPAQQLRSYCLCVAWFHFALMLTYIIITARQDQGYITIPRLRTQTTQSLGVWLLPEDTSTANITGLANALDLNKCPIASTTPAKDSKYVVQQTIFSATELDTRALIIAFHGLSWIFQLISALDEHYKTSINAGKANILHFVEYSISASIMLIAISAQLGITDVYLLISLATNCWACMIFGVLAESLWDSTISFTIALPKFSDNLNNWIPGFLKRKISLGVHWAAHLAGWVTLAIALLCTSSNLTMFNACINSSSSRKPPTWVQAMIGLEIFMFTVFGYVQAYSFYAREHVNAEKKDDRGEPISVEVQKKKIAEYTEFAYITLSISAKVALGVFIMAGNYSNK